MTSEAKLQTREAKSEIRDGMRIDWDVPITMDDGVVLRCDVYRPIAEGKVPGDPQLRSVREVAAFRADLQDLLGQDGRRASRGAGGLDQPLPELGGRRSGEVGAGRLRLRARRLARLRPLARLCGPVGPARDAGFRAVHRMGRRAAVVERKSRPERHLLLCDEPMAGGRAAAETPRRDVRLGRRERLVPRGEPPGRHPLHLPRQLVRHAGEDGAARPGHARLSQPDDRRLGVRAADALGRGAACQPLRLRPPRARARVRRRVLALAHARLVEDRDAAPFQRQLGRPGSAPARQHRGLRQRGQQGKVARDARRRALDPLLYGLRAQDAEEVLRLLPEGREERLGPPAEGPPADPAPRREIRRARGERVAACAHPVDEAAPRRAQPHPVAEPAEGRGQGGLPGILRGRSPSCCRRSSSRRKSPARSRRSSSFPPPPPTRISSSSSAPSIRT